jgi:molybdopterin synthase sulfur carrier subunit
LHPSPWEPQKSAPVFFLTETVEARRHVNLFVANENVRYTGGLSTAIPAGAEVSIVPAISGG